MSANDSSIATLLAAIPFVLAALVFGYLMVACLRQVRSMNFPWGENKIEPADINVVPPSGVQDIMQSLERLGFQPLGVLKASLFWRPDHSFYCWYYIDKDKTTYAEMTEYKTQPSSAGLVGLFSRFPDDALMELFYPIGETIEEQNYSAHFAKDSLERGYAFHQEKLRQWTPVHGTPIIIHNLEQLRQYEAVDKKLYRTRRFRRFTVIFSLLVIVSLAIVLLSIYEIYILISIMSIPSVDILDYVRVPLLMWIFCIGVFWYLFSLPQKPSGAIDTKQ